MDLDLVSVGALRDYVQQLMADPRSRLRAADAGWSHPTTWAEVVAMSTYDLLAAVYTRKGSFRPYPRPWSRAVKVNRTGRKRTAAEVYARLRPNR